ncbi:MAG: spermidine synthase, partial [Thermodesulfobacteriota bacterium]
TTNGNPQVGSMNLDVDYTGPERALNLESRRIYELPYRFLSPSKVLIAGAGAGNETEVALRAGAARVTAVELDPVFVELGRKLSPHRPFTDPRVTVRVDDARAFFQNTTEKYDLVVIGFLDSQYRLAHLSNLRTENFVYTYESLARTRDLLAEGGILQLNYNAARSDMRAKLYEMLRDIYGAKLAVYVPTDPVSANISFVAGPGVGKFDRPVPGLSRAVIETGEGGDGGKLSVRWPTDDWPFLYLEKKMIPREYWTMLAVVPLISLFLITVIGRGGWRRDGSGVLGGFSPKFFLLGAGFMLLETKSITSFALIFGSTIDVVSVVLASILSAILVSNLVIHRFGLKGLTAPYILTVSTIAVLYFVPLGPFVTLHGTAKLAASSVVIAAPIFFSAMVFGVSFSRSTRIDADFGSNIFGAVVGGMSEYFSMATGFSALYILSMAAYLAAFALERRRAG